MDDSDPPLATCSNPDCQRPIHSRGLCQPCYRRALRAERAVPRTCVRCGNTIPASRNSNAQYCGDECRLPTSDRQRTTDATCVEPGCDRYPNGARGYCRPCYHKHKNAGDFGGQICTKEECERLIYGRGLCQMHLWRAYESGELAKPSCAVDGCDRPSRANGLCHRHLMRVRAHGEPGEAEARRRAKGEGYLDPNGYVNVSIDGRRKLQHRVVMEQHLGRDLRPDENVHHKNGNRSDNRLVNLELWSSWQPYGQRVEDKVAWAVDLLKLYAPQYLA